MQIKKVRNRYIFFAFASVVFSFIYITINSKNSFLYSFNNSEDIHQFVTAVRCMLKGDVLYKDVYEVKGPYLYFLYYIGACIFNNPFRGIYAIELVSFAIYLFMIFKISSLYFKNDLVNLLTVAIVGFYSTSTYTLFGGGQCEELLLSVFSVVMYIALRYVKLQYPEKIKFIDVVLIGFLFGFVFFIKYALTGLFIGLVLFIVYIQIKTKKPVYILHYALEFLLGFAISFIPVLIYFVYNNAFDSFIKVYFYDMLFVYKPDVLSGSSITDSLFYFTCFNTDLFAVIALLCVMFSSSRLFSLNEKILIFLGEFITLLGMSFSYMWGYSPEMVHAFCVFGVIGVFLIIKDKRQLIIDTSKKVFQFFLDFTDKKCKVSDWLLIVLILLSVTVFKNNIGEFSIYVLGDFFAFLLFREMTILINAKLPKARPVTRNIIRYSIIFISGIIVCFSSYETATSIFFVMVLFFSMEIYTNRKSIKEYIQKNDPNLKKVLTSKPMKAVFSVVCACAFAFLSGFAALNASPVTYDINQPLETFPQYIMSEYIKDSNVENPYILNYRIIDEGVFWLTKTYPSAIYIGENMQSEEIENYYDECIAQKKPDFIVTRLSDDIDGYTLAYRGKRAYVTENLTYSYFLFVKDSIYEENQKNNVKPKKLKVVELT